MERNVLDLPSALECHQEIFHFFNGKSVAVFLDYDGTLTPIVASPELAILSEETRETLKQLAMHCTVGIISGRDRANVHQLVNVNSLFYAGSHGFDISGPQDWKIQHEIGIQFVPALDHAEAFLNERLHSVKGTLIERKKFSIAVHYRLVNPCDLEVVRIAVESVVSQHNNLRITEGKMVYDLQPRIEWDKGKALLWLLDSLNLAPNQVLPLYLGDDLTDENPFRVLQDKGVGGVGVVVEDTARITHATYRLNDTVEVHQFLQHLLHHVRGFSS